MVYYYKTDSDLIHFGPTVHPNAWQGKKKWNHKFLGLFGDQFTNESDQKLINTPPCLLHTLENICREFILTFYFDNSSLSSVEKMNTIFLSLRWRFSGSIVLQVIIFAIFQATLTTTYPLNSITIEIANNITERKRNNLRMMFNIF